MKKLLTNGKMATLIVLAVIIIDQLIKVAVKTNMYLHESIRVTDWAYIYFTENNGMAFGMEIIGKTFLSVFRLVAVVLIGIYLAKIVTLKRFTRGFIACVALVMGGAIGNIVDCLFYGLIFSNSSSYELAHFVPFGEGYTTFLHGRVVDMFYFPIIDTFWPQWMPFVGGSHFVFFSPIFNFADAAISCGIIAMLIFYGKTINDLFHDREGKNIL
jgi:signal peptidase II